MTNLEVSLKEKGYKLTEQRQIIWQVMLENTGKHLSPKEIWEIARNKDTSLGIATVYRTIKLMDDLGIIASFNKKDELNKYEFIADGEGSTHPHLICLNCGKIIGITQNLLANDLKEIIKKEYNFELKDIRIKCYGLCQECRQKSAQQSQ